MSGVFTTYANKTTSITSLFQSVQKTKKGPSLCNQRPVEQRSPLDDVCDRCSTDLYKYKAKFPLTRKLAKMRTVFALLVGLLCIELGKFL